MNHATNRLPGQFTLSKLIGVMALYCFVFATLAGLPAEYILTVAGVVSPFVFVDLVGWAGAPQTAPLWSLIALKLSHYSTALAYAIAACGVVYVSSFAAEPSPTAAGASANPTPDEAFGHLIVLLLVIGMSLVGTLLCSAVGIAAALLSLRHCAYARVMLIANTPWMLLFGYLLVCNLVD
jgi:hypothetical protein